MTRDEALEIIEQSNVEFNEDIVILHGRYTIAELHAILQLMEYY